MKRTTLMTALCGAAVLLAGCSSTSGTAAPATSSTSSAVATSSSAMSSPSSSMSSSVAPTSSASSSEAPTSSASSSEPPSSSASRSAESSSSDTAESTASSSKSAPPTTTVGDQTEGLDARTKTWFTAFCTGTAPVVDGAKQLTQMSSSSSAADQKKVVSYFETLGTSLTKTAATLKGLPAPTFSGGSEFAGKVVTAFGSAGPALTAAAKKIAANPTTPDASAMSGLTDSLQKAVAPLEDLGSLKLTAATQAGIEKIPACAAVQKAATG